MEGEEYRSKETDEHRAGAHFGRLALFFLFIINRVSDCTQIGQSHVGVHKNEEREGDDWSDGEDMRLYAPQPILCLTKSDLAE